MQGSNTNLEIILSLKDEASSSFKKIADNATTAFKKISDSGSLLNKDVTGLSKVLGGTFLAGAGAVVAFGVSAIKASADAEKGMARITSALKAIGPEAVANKDKLLEMADATMKLGFDNDESAESLAKFYQRTKDLTQAQNLNNIAMDLARAKQIDLSSATNLVNMVLSGQGRVLAQYGISIKDSATPIEALTQLQKELAGQATAASQTFSVQMQVVSLYLDDFKKQIGAVLIEALMPFITQFNAWLTNPNTLAKFKEWTAEFKSWADVIIPTVIETFRLWGSALQTVLNTLIAIGNEITKIGGARSQAMSQGSKAGFSGVMNQVIGVGGATQQFFSDLTGLKPFASGGIVTGPTPALVGEAGPEAIIPLSKLSTGMGGITINVTGGNFLGDAEELAKMLGDKMISQFMRINKL